VAEKQFNVALSDQILTGFGWHDSEVPSRVKEALVTELLRLDRLSEAEAAEALNLDRWELLEVMGLYGIPAIHLTPEELRSELGEEIKDDDLA